MGSIITLPFIWVINKIVAVNDDLNGNWISYLLVRIKLWLIRRRESGRFETHNPLIDGDPYVAGILPFESEWNLESPSKVRERKQDSKLFESVNEISPWEYTAEKN